MAPTILAFGLPGSWEWILILVVALLIFGRRLPDVARSVGKSIVEFKRGIKEVHNDIEDRSRNEPAKPSKLESPPNSTSEPASTDDQGKDSQPTKESSHTTG